MEPQAVQTLEEASNPHRVLALRLEHHIARELRVEGRALFRPGQARRCLLSEPRSRVQSLHIPGWPQV